MKLNENGEYIVEHHVKYKELHGYDETIWMTQSEHTNLHIRLRKEGKCNISSQKLNKIAMAAHNRTKKERIRTKTRIRQKYNNNNQIIDFYETPGRNTEFHERIVYNHVNGTINYCGRYRGKTGHKLPIVNI